MRAPNVLRSALPILIALTLTLGCGGGDDDDGPTAPVDTALSLTAAGWEHFAAQRHPEAAASFESALALTAGYGPALVGLGWSHLQLATTSAAFQEAVATFDQAVAAGQAGADVLCGRAAARLALGGPALTAAVNDAQAALATAPAFRFSHRPTIDATDLRLVVAFARAAQDDLPAALAATAPIAASGIVEGQPASWVVDGVTYQSFAGAALAWLHALAEAHAG
jgi:hypothetical protein